MTSHEFARKLLEGPDLPIVTPNVHESGPDSWCMEPPQVREETCCFRDTDPEFQAIVVG